MDDGNLLLFPTLGVRPMSNLFGTTETATKIRLRAEQREAIEAAKRCFRKVKSTKSVSFLWNAKMRFGKTLCAMQLARELGVRRTLIVTHRPVVSQGWQDDFNKVVSDSIIGNDDVSETYKFGSQSLQTATGNSYYDLETFVTECEANHYVFFVSMQYLCLSDLFSGIGQPRRRGKKEELTPNERLKRDILNTHWDLVVIDEAHEGTRTELGRQVIDGYLTQPATCLLHLSGTPFNLYSDFAQDHIYTWDYTREQSAKRAWAQQHPGEENPYAGLPQLTLFTYDLAKSFSAVKDTTGTFTFAEFLRTWTPSDVRLKGVDKERVGHFVYEAEVRTFIEKLRTKDPETNFPFSTEAYRDRLRHTLWVVAHVSEARELERLLRADTVFGNSEAFTIINVSGDEGNESGTAIDRVRDAITDCPELSKRTITLSCGRLTVGVTVPGWSAVLYLRGGDTPATYMQTIFRVQSPYTTKDKEQIKTHCYAFDFLPDRAFRLLADTASFTARAERQRSKSDKETDREAVERFIELCPIYSLDGGRMGEINVERVINSLEKAYIDRLVRKGFDDNCLYDLDQLNKMDTKVIADIGKRGGNAPKERAEKPSVIDVNHMTAEQKRAWDKKRHAEAMKTINDKRKSDPAFTKRWDEMSEAERQEYIRKEEERQQRKEERDEFRKRVTNIRGIALRIPLLMYGGADTGRGDKEITVDNFTRVISDEAWHEFMPKGIEKKDFNAIRHCFNAARFAEAGRQYRALTRAADSLPIEQRIAQITEIFSYFHNPDKETVLTSWEVVNLHLRNTLGGYAFYDDKRQAMATPELVDNGKVTEDLFLTADEHGNIPVRILEINSKTGLYPLYATYSLYRRKLIEYKREKLIDDTEEMSVEEQNVVWDDVLKENIFVLCNTRMAENITRRTLIGFRELTFPMHLRCLPLIEYAKENKDDLIHQLTNHTFWTMTTKNTKSSKSAKPATPLSFDAVIGNPPYQEELRDTSDSPVYNHFMDVAFEVSPRVTLITPGRYLFNAGKTPRDWNKKILNDEHFRVVSYYPKSTEVFPNIDIKGGVAIFMRDQNEDFGKIGTFSYYPEIQSLIYKVLSSSSFKSISPMVYPQNKFDLQALYADHPELKEHIGSEGRERRLTTNIFALNTIFTEERQHEGDIMIIGLINNNRVSRYIDRKYLAEHINLDSYKVLVPKSNGSGAIGEVLSTPLIGSPLIGSPLIGHTQTFISIGNFTTEAEAENCMKYIKTRFARTMLGTLKATQHNSRNTWAYVPLQDFTESSDIPWGKSIDDIDAYLFAKYGLDLDERAFIMEKVRPME